MTRLSPCLAPGCPELVNGETYCRRHRARNKTSAIRLGLTPCIVAGCPELTPGGGRCERHQAIAARAPGVTKRRPRPNAYTGRWRAIAARYLQAHPTCEWPGCSAPAQLVHHRDGTGRLGAAANNHADNLEALCRAHHGRRHAELHHAGVVELGPQR